jgi:hypothetical protein
MLRRENVRLELLVLGCLHVFFFGDLGDQFVVQTESTNIDKEVHRKCTSCGCMRYRLSLSTCKEAESWQSYRPTTTPWTSDAVEALTVSILVGIDAQVNSSSI